MDQGTLVEKQIDDGLLLIQRLIEEGVPVTAAAWIKESDSGLWFLYLVTPLVSEDTGTRQTYGLVNAVFRKMPQPLWVEPLEIKLVGADSRLGKALHDFQKQYGGRSPVRYSGASLGGLSVEGAHVYAPVPATVG